MKVINGLSGCLTVLIASLAFAQPFTRDNYFDYIPAVPKIVTQTAASAKLHLYGNPADPAYRDSSWVDGVDDDRAERLRLLAWKFAPVLRRNNFSVPRDFEEMLILRYDGKKRALANQPALLYRDTWDVTHPAARRVFSDSVNLTLLNIPENTGLYVANDQKLKNLLQTHHPDNPQTMKVKPEHQQQEVIFFDFPGHDAPSWKAVYRQVKSPAKIYAHFFIHEDPGSLAAARYNLIAQYWFFYPFNDGGNDHEGDWEHINVWITTLGKGAASFSPGEMAQILDNTHEGIVDSLVIKKVDYYFHHFVASLDYQCRDLHDTLQSREVALKGQNWITRKIYDRIHFFPDAFNTHPICYIGADNMGLDQILSGIGGRNRNSHGTYPFPGIWRQIGPLGATEKVNGEQTCRFLPPEKYPSRGGLGRLDSAPEKYEAKDDPDYITFSMADITLLPDWECLIDLALQQPEMRRRWFWLMLPIRWGFPVAESPGAGVMKGIDLGNVAPVGPAFSSGWNRTGACRGFEAYQAFYLPSQFPLALQDNFHNAWGFLNLTWPTLISFPTTNLIWSFTGDLLKSDPKFMAHQDVPFRFISFTWRPAITWNDKAFSKLLQKVVNPEDHTDQYEQENIISWINVLVALHIGQFASENGFSIASSDLSYGSHGNGRVHGELKFMELSGSFRRTFGRKTVQPFIRAGYGWNWYRFENIVAADNPTVAQKTEWYHNPRFPYFPNTWHAGAGIELFPRRNVRIASFPVLKSLFMSAPEAGLRLDYTFHIHKLGRDAPGDDWIQRQEISAGLVVSF